MENIENIEKENEKNWLQRNWLWLIPTGCLGMIAVCVTCVGLIYGVVVVSIRSSTPYQDAMTRVQSSTEVQSALGPPVEPGFFIQGNISIENSGGEADFQVPLNGSAESGTLYVVADRSNRIWEFVALEVETESGQVIDLK